MSEYLIGFANSDEQNQFAVAIREGLEAAVADHPDFNLIWRDNQANTDTATANVQEFAEIPVDLAVIFHIDERAGGSLAMPLKMKRIPIISIELPIPMTVFLGIDNEIAGQMCGEAGGQWIRAHWSGEFEKIVVLADKRVLSGHRKRFDSALETLQQHIPYDENNVLFIDSGTDRAISREVFRDLLASWHDFRRIVVLTMGDVVSMGVLDAARDVGREQDIVILSFDGTQAALDELQNPSSRLLVSPAFHPERYGEYILDLAERMLNGERVPFNNLIEPEYLAREM